MTKKPRTVMDFADKEDFDVSASFVTRSIVPDLDPPFTVGEIPGHDSAALTAMRRQLLAIQGINLVPDPLEAKQPGDTYVDPLARRLMIRTPEGDLPFMEFESALVGEWPTNIEIGDLSAFQPAIRRFVPDQDEWTCNQSYVERVLNFAPNDRRWLINDPMDQWAGNWRYWIGDRPYLMQGHGSFPRLLGHLISFILPEVKATFEPLKEFLRYAGTTEIIDGILLVRGETLESTDQGRSWKYTYPSQLQHVRLESYRGDGTALVKDLSPATRILIMPRQTGKASFLAQLKNRYQ